ncbi:MAG: hypothetical protein IKU52_04870, partial [Clostridia bacterium]|nr:hypothetical protein [Clostridia bacterium]
MKNFKRVLSILMVLMMLVSTFVATGITSSAGVVLVYVRFENWTGNGDYLDLPYYFFDNQTNPFSTVFGSASGYDAYYANLWATSKTGYTFGGYKCTYTGQTYKTLAAARDSGKSFPKATANQIHLMTAVWTQKTYTLTLNGNGGTINGSSSKSYSIKYGQTYSSAFGGSFPTPVRSGYTFKYYDYNNGVFGLTASNMGSNTWTLDGNATMTAVWECAHSSTKTTTTAATCTSNGKTVVTCNTCGKTVSTTTINATGHSYGSWSTTTAATCTTAGTQTRTCSKCSANDTQGIAATGHSYGSWSTTTAATCTTAGTQTRTCSKCSAKETQNIAATGHSYTSVVTAPTCTAQGYTTYTCSKCSNSYVDNYVAATGHSYGSWSTTTAATCTTEGVQTRICSKCSAKETQSIDKTGHNYSSVVTQPTCTVDGYTTYTCTNCSYSYTDNIVDALGHTEVVDKAVAA